MPVTTLKQFKSVSSDVILNCNISIITTIVATGHKVPVNFYITRIILIVD